MCGDSVSHDSFDEIEGTLADAVAQVRSLEELRQWLASQRCVASVGLEDYLIKTNPPQRQFRVEFRLDDGSTAVKAIDVFVLDDHELRFRDSAVFMTYDL